MARIFGKFDNLYSSPVSTILILLIGVRRRVWKCINSARTGHCGSYQKPFFLLQSPNEWTSSIVWYKTGSDGEAQDLEIWRMWITPSLLYLLGPPWPVKVPPVDQINLFKNYLYLLGILSPGVLGNVEYPFIAISPWFNINSK